MLHGQFVQFSGTDLDARCVMMAKIQLYLSGLPVFEDADHREGWWRLLCRRAGQDTSSAPLMGVPLQSTASKIPTAA